MNSPRLDNETLCAALCFCRQPSDVEFFTWTSTAAGTVVVQLLGAPAWTFRSISTQLIEEPRSNLNATVTVMNAQGSVLKTATGVGVGPFTTAVLPAGMYYVSVKPSAGGDPVRAAYSAYGSIGQYELVVIYATAAPVSNVDNSSQVNCMCAAPESLGVGRFWACILHSWSASIHSMPLTVSMLSEIAGIAALHRVQCTGTVTVLSTQQQH
jgi:hypothetical protein